MNDDEQVEELVEALPPRMVTLSVMTASDMVIDEFSSVAASLSRDGYQVQFTTTPLSDFADDRRERAEKIAEEIDAWFTRRGGHIQPHESIELGLVIEAVL